MHARYSIERARHALLSDARRVATVRSTCALLLHLRERSSSSFTEMMKRTMLFAKEHLHNKLCAVAAVNGSLGARDVRWCVRWNE